MFRSVPDVFRHKRALMGVRLVFVLLVGAMALPPFLKGTLSPVLPTILAAYLFTNVAMAFERTETFFRQRIQAALLIFDIFVLVLAIATLEADRQDLFLAMFLVVLLASAGQRLSVSIGGFVAVAAFYLWFSRDPETGAIDWSSSTATGLPVLLVVAIYVGYVSESVAREHRKRREAEDRLAREVQGMNRVHALLSNTMLEPDPARLFAAMGDAARSLLDAPRTAVFWSSKGEPEIRRCLSDGFPDDLAREWASPSSPLRGNIEGKEPFRLPPRPDGFLSIVAPFADRVGGLVGCLLVAWPPAHKPFPAEEEAARMLVQQASLCMENASLYRVLSQTRDVWQSAFQSIPTPVVIVNGDGRMVQANPAFLALGEFDLATLPGTSFLEVLEGACHADGRPLAPEEIRASTLAVRLTIPRLGGAYEVNRGPYLGAGDPEAGSVWVLRRLAPDLAPR
jgi:PAS domain-containing protein